jgi:hypothetical protein
MKPSSLQTIILLFIFAIVLSSCAVEEIPKYNLSTTVSPTEGGKIILSPQSPDYKAGDVVTLTAEPNEHWVFKQWEGDGSGSSTPVQITMTGNKSVVGVFVKRDYPLTLTIEGEGTVEEKIVTNPGGKVYPHGTTVELTPKPTNGWVFSSWGGDLTGSETPKRIIIDKEKKVTGKFVRNQTVIAAGSVFNIPFVMRDGIETRLQGRGSVNSIFLSGSDEYLAGTTEDQVNSYALIWKNGTKTTLQSKYPSNAANSIFVNGNDVYVAGSGQGNFTTPSGQSAILWKNGTPVYLTGTGDGGGNANSVFVSNNIVYVAGWEDLGSGIFAKFWKNGVGTNLVTPIPTNPSTTYSKATSIFVNGADVYVGGYQYFEDANTSKMIAKIWKNGNPMTLTNTPGETIINAISISGTDVYSAGMTEGCLGSDGRGTGIATYWKNGTPVYLSDCTKQWGVAHTIFIKGTDVYVGGFIRNAQESGIAENFRRRYVIWKNGTILKISSLGGDGGTTVQAIAVK